nr:hypothetical protein [Tanacetum cinerariifolium]
DFVDEIIVELTPLWNEIKEDVNFSEYLAVEKKKIKRRSEHRITPGLDRKKLVRTENILAKNHGLRIRLNVFGPVLVNLVREGIIANSRTIYNLKAKIRRDELGDRSNVRALLDELEKECPCVIALAFCSCVIGLVLGAFGLYNIKAKRLAAARTYHNSTGPPSWLPSLIFLVEREDDKKSRELFLLSNKSIRMIRLREAYCKLGFSHNGDNKWTYVEHSLDNSSICDITFYYGQVYTFGLNNTIRACDVNGKDPIDLVDVAKIPEDVYDETMFLVYLVGLDDGERKRLLV